MSGALYYPDRRRPGGDFSPPWRKFPEASLDYTERIPDAIDPAADFIATLTLAVAPSGPGELVVSTLFMRGDDIVFTAAGGQPRRSYILKFIATATNGRVFEFVGEMVVMPLLTTDQPQPPPVSGFGTPIVCLFGPSLNFTRPRNSALRLWGWN